MRITLGSLSLQLAEDGVAVVEFCRPPVNAVSLSVYEDLGRLVDTVEAEAGIRVVVLTAPEDLRAWCGGADLKDFVGMDAPRREERYRFINAQIPRLYRLDRPVIAAITGATVGIGVLLAGICDLRIAAAEATFACPEIDFGLIAGSAGLLAMLKLPEGMIRELMYTGRRFRAAEMRACGFLNDVVAREQLRTRALDLAQRIAQKSLPVLRARKAAFVAIEGRGWMDAYLDAQQRSAALVTNADSGEGVQAFLAHRNAHYRDQ